jgi:hypothetical protein
METSSSDEVSGTRVIRSRWHWLSTPLPKIKKAARNGKPPWFRSREEDMAGFNDDNPTTCKENVNGKGKVDDCYAEFEGRETSSKDATW